MIDLDAWHRTNNEYLSAAVRWLRLRLARLVEQQQRIASQPIQTSISPFTLPLGADLPAQPDDASSDPLGQPEADQLAKVQIEQAAAAMEQAATSEPAPALSILSRRLGLVRFEEQILLLCAAMELDTRIAALCAHAQNDKSRPNPTFALALALFDNPVWEALSPERPLRYWRLIEINQPGAQPLTASALRADERVVNYLKGLNYLDDRLTTLLAPLIDVADDLPPSQQEQVGIIVRHLRAARNGLPVVHLLGTDTDSKRSIAKHVAHKLRLSIYRLPADMLPATLPELEILARLYQRESKMLPLALYLDAQDSDKELPAINRLLSRIDGPVFLDTYESWPQLGRDALTLDVTKPTPAEQEEVWQQVLGEDVGNGSALLASQFNLNLHEIQRAAHAATDHKKPTIDQAWDACLIASRPRLDSLAQRLELTAQVWDDLVLPELEKKLLRQIMSQVGQRHLVYEHWGFNRKLNRGLGINALFAGESGTGKTLAAEVIARELKLNLYRIDLSQVVSKYIGETEKNLRKLFDAAEDGGTILFFDEADALFGKRSEVKDSHDRYANIEINYLLQRMEAYHGLAILATNRKSALDTAFMRRLRFIVTFPFPGIPERKLIWERAFPKETAKDGLDYERLARLSLTGGGIQNIAINAAFLAAGVGSPVTMPLILEAAKTEFRKLDKPINEAEFRLIQAMGAST
ncbi:ATPase family protein associated with various cellular activities (AAA) [Nitrosospira sp. Nsp5]|uniref:ATPase family associated with various cellular activities (AAA) n=1 Tax=Nitrosospira multiformis TaxID=1231 RepID=A0ABY0TCJ9_9PROT|nr:MULTISPECIES: ATP-binding protein [Nitrosospira]PTR05762.1 ATPase family protein associated with various cellular activities (AAA) [Nitrosospira sp. Nsp5]SDQ62336.1 ATPase family associated with various cellular activities (AAA) [Nitrosospira multiformis]